MDLDLAKLALDIHSDDLGAVEQARVKMQSLRGKPVGPLVELLTSPDQGVRSGAVLLLAETAGEAAVKPLGELLTDDDESVRDNARYALDCLADELTTDFLLALLKDESAGLRSYAARELPQRRDIRALEPLTMALADPSASVRMYAARAFHLIRVFSDMDIEIPTRELLALLSDPSDGVRAESAETLGYGNADLVILPLIAALKDPCAEVRGKAALSLMMTDDPSAIEALLEMPVDSDATMRSNLAYALSRSQSYASSADTRVLERLIVMLADSENAVRAAAAEGLGWIGDPRAIDALIAARNDSNPEVRECVEDALGDIGGSLPSAFASGSEGEIEGEFVPDLSGVSSVAEKVTLLKQAERRVCHVRSSDPKFSVNLSDHDVDLLRLYASDSEPVVRAAAVAMLAQYGPVTWEDIERWMLDESKGVRDAADPLENSAASDLCMTDQPRCAGLYAESARAYGSFPVSVDYLCTVDEQWADLMWTHLGPLLDLGDPALNSNIICGILEDMLRGSTSLGDPRLQAWITGNSVERKMALLSVAQWFGLKEPWHKEMANVLANDSNDVVSRTARGLLADVRTVQDIQFREWAQQPAKED